MNVAVGGVAAITTAMLYSPLPSHKGGLRELADNSIVLTDEYEALIAKLNPALKGIECIDVSKEKAGGLKWRHPF